MKAKFLISFMLLAFGAWATSGIDVKTQHFEVSDSIRMFDPKEPQDLGFKFTKSASADWPVTVNGKKCPALNEFLVESVFYASHNPKSFPNIPEDVNTLAGCVKKWVHDILRENVMVQEYTIKEMGPGIQDISPDKEPERCWYETVDMKLNHTEGNILFFVENGSSYYGGAHDTYGASYYPFDVALNRPIQLKDIVTSTSKVLRLIPKYDKRDKDCKWYDDVHEVDIENFYVKGNKLVFVFQPYQVGPFSDGIVEVPIPLKTLLSKKLLTKYGRSLLK